MAILGYLIKNLIEFKHYVAPQQPTDYVAAQERQLEYLLTKAQDTAFGRHFNFKEMLASGAGYAVFKNRVPIYDYDRMHAEWWQRQMKEDDITWPGMPQYFARSSGTTSSEPKLIPATDDMLDHFKSVGRAQAESLANFNLDPTFFEKDVLALSSSADLEERDGFLIGEISGINVSNLPPLLSNYYKPGLDIAQLSNWDERLAAIVEEAPNWDVGAIAGIPSWVQLMLKTIIERYELETIHDLWPDLSVFTTGGVAFEPWRETFNSILARPIIIMDTYLASEGFFAYNARPDTMAMHLAVNNGVFFEFIPFDERGFDDDNQLLPDPMVIPLSEVELGQDYALIVSTPAGAWRYMIGDTVKFTDLQHCEIVITGRTKYFLNVVGSQLSEEKLNQAVVELSRNNSIQVPEFAVAAVQDEQGNWYHQWVLGLESGEIDEQQAADQLDAVLQQGTKAYRQERTQNRIKGLLVQVVPIAQVHDWLEKTRKKGGQIKLPKVMKQDQMRELLDFLRIEA